MTSINELTPYELANYINKNTQYISRTGTISIDSIDSNTGQVKKNYSKTYQTNHLNLPKEKVRIKKFDNAVIILASKETNCMILDLDIYKNNISANDALKDIKITKGCWIDYSASGGLKIYVAYDEEIDKLIAGDKVQHLDVNGLTYDIFIRHQAVIGCTILTDTDNDDKEYKYKWHEKYNPFTSKVLPPITQEYKNILVESIKKYKAKAKEKNRIKVSLSNKQIPELQILLNNIDIDKRDNNANRHSIICAIAYETDKSEEGYLLIEDFILKMKHYSKSELITQWKSIKITKSNNSEDAPSFNIHTLRQYAKEDNNFDLLKHQIILERLKPKIDFSTFADKWANVIIDSEGMLQRFLLDTQKTIAILETGNGVVKKYSCAQWETISWESLKHTFYIRIPTDKPGKYNNMSLDKLVVPNRIYMPIFDKEQFAPSIQLDNPKIFNAWTGFKAQSIDWQKPINSVKIDMTLVNPWIKLIKEGWAHKEDDYCKEWLFQRLIAPLNNPNIKLQTKVVVYNKKQQVALKGRFADFIVEQVIGRTHSTVVQGLSALVERFNHEFAYMIYIFSNEATVMGDYYHDTFSKLKDLDDQFFKTEQKYGEKTRRENKQTHVIYTNFPDAVKVELGDTRYGMYEAKEDWPEEFKQLIIKLHTCPESAKHFLAYAQQYDIDFEMLRKAPMTTMKKESMITSLPVIERFLIELKSNPHQFGYDKPKIQSDKLYSQFKVWTDTQNEPRTPSLTKFGRVCSQWMVKIKDGNIYYDISTISISNDVVQPFIFPTQKLMPSKPNKYDLMIEKIAKKEKEFSFEDTSSSDE